MSKSAALHRAVDLLRQVDSSPLCEAATCVERALTAMAPYSGCGFVGEAERAARQGRIVAAVTYLRRALG